MAEECHTVLLVEDDRIDQLAFRRFIKEHSHRFDFEIVDSVSQAGELLKKRFFDVIITDFNLGDGTAFDIMAMNHLRPRVARLHFSSSQNLNGVFLRKMPDSGTLKRAPAATQGEGGAWRGGAAFEGPVLWWGSTFSVPLTGHAFTG